LYLDSLQFFWGKRSDEGVFISDGGVDILLSAQLSCFGFGDEPTVELGSKDVPWGSKVVDVDIGYGCRGRLFG